MTAPHDLGVERAVTARVFWSRERASVCSGPEHVIADLVAPFTADAPLELEYQAKRLWRSRPRAHAVALAELPSMLVAARQRYSGLLTIRVPTPGPNVAPPARFQEVDEGAGGLRAWILDIACDRPVDISSPLATQLRTVFRKMVEATRESLVYGYCGYGEYTIDRVRTLEVGGRQVPIYSTLSQSETNENEVRSLNLLTDFGHARSVQRGDPLPPGAWESASGHG